MFRNAKIGDKVWSFTDGWGEVVELHIDYFYPLVVEFINNNKIPFRLDGNRNYLDKYPVLFWDEVKFEVPKKPLPDLPIDTKVLVWHDEDLKFKRYFKKFDDRKKIVCFSDGATSWVTNNYTNTWNYWELAE